MAASPTAVSMVQPGGAGATVAIEPKFVFPGRGAVGIENTWAVTASGGEKLTGLLADDVLRVA